MKPTFSAAFAALCAVIVSVVWASSDSSSVLTGVTCAALLGASLDYLRRFARPRLEEVGAYLAEFLPERTLSWRGVAGEFALGAGILAMTLFVLWPIPFEQPLSQDHANHYLNLEIFWELLSSGHLFGWTDRVATGRPFGDTYGTLVYLLPTVPKVLSLGWLSTGTCYAISIFWVWFFGAMVVGGITRQLTSGWVAPWLASAAFLLDVGADREGGWLYSMFHAVWPQWFASMMFLLSVWTLVRLWEEPTRRRLGMSMLLIGVSIWMHPMNALNFLIFAPILALVLGVSKRQGHLVWVVIAHIGGAMIGLGWMIHMLVGRSNVGEYVASGSQLLSLGQNWWTGVLFENSAVVWGVLGLAGVVTVLHTRKTREVVILSGAVVFTMLQSMELLAGLELAHWDGLPDLMWRRFVLSAKPFWFVLAGVGSAMVLAGMRSLKGTHAGQSSLVWIVVAPVFVALLLTVDRVAPAPAMRPLHSGQAGLEATLEALTTLLRAESSEVKGRVAFWRDRGEDGEIPLIAFANVDLDYIGSSVPPTQTFVHSNAGRDLKTLRLLGVRWVVSHGQVSDEGLVKAGMAGPYVVYRVKGKVAEFPVELEGPGHLVVESWTPMRRVIQLTGTTSETHLDILHGPYLKWSAHLPGGGIRPLTLIKRGNWRFSRVSELSDGRVEIVFSDTPMERGLFVLALVLVVGAFILVAREQRLPEVDPRFRADQWIVGWTAVLLLMGVLFLWSEGRSSATAFWKRDEPEATRVLALLHQQLPEDVRWTPDPYCVRPFSRNPRVGCQESSLQPHLEWNEKTQSACLGFGVPDRGETRLRVGLPEGTQWVKGVLTVEKTVAAELVTHGKRTRIPGGVFRLDAAHQVELVVRNSGSTTRACIEWVALGR